jgi:hypothetical protein
MHLCDKNGSDWLIQTGSGFAKSAGTDDPVVCAMELNPRIQVDGNRLATS